MEEETIAAISTAPGEGGIGIVRLSGARAQEVLARVFVPARGGAGGAWAPGRRMRYGHVVDPSTGERVDEALAVVMPGPRSYTGEDVAEIQCHGGPVPLRRILELCFAAGAAPAAPGEFTKRAFLSGRIDLVQAGAVIDLIRAGTERAYRAAQDQAEGRLSGPIREARALLLAVLTEITARIDYPEAFDDEAGLPPTPTLFRESTEQITSILRSLLATAGEGRIVRDGLRVCIIGAPNVGKSSLFNALARENAAIVTAVPGTTRDALEIWLNVRGLPVLLSDTAGIREAAGEVEALGIEKSRAVYGRADMALFVLDGSRPLSGEDAAIAASLDPAKATLLVLNKQDLPQAFSLVEAEALAPFADKALGSALRPGELVRAIEDAIERAARAGAQAGTGALVTRAWQAELLSRALAETEEGREVLALGEAPEFAEVNMRAAYDALGELIGESVSDDVLNRVFEEFCVGK
ncbi:MAG: tRNA uridine-5-carboxymethylaminomethyl(34) synthesis GTPase MnmE [Clostridiales Family XIII bacterium]|jgi:tRNA modification GTPase|nr:tRNA uridine-5-carboxymethylaminomethyl(34) synthesis GTPase MnmE [Clostridiales Family XIII bacterium]